MTHVCMHIDMHRHIVIHIHIQTHSYIYAYVHAFMCACIQTQLCRTGVSDATSAAQSSVSLNKSGCRSGMPAGYYIKLLKQQAI